MQYLDSQTSAPHALISTTTSVISPNILEIRCQRAQRVNRVNIFQMEWHTPLISSSSSPILYRPPSLHIPTPTTASLAPSPIPRSSEFESGNSQKVPNTEEKGGQ
jgi:hypothetical protein